MLKQADIWESPKKPVLVASGRTSNGARYVPTFRHEVVAPSRWNRMVESAVFHIFFILLLITIAQLAPTRHVNPVELTNSTPLISPYMPRGVTKTPVPLPKLMAK